MKFLYLRDLALTKGEIAVAVPPPAAKGPRRGLFIFVAKGGPFSPAKRTPSSDMDYVGDKKELGEVAGTKMGRPSEDPTWNEDWLNEDAAEEELTWNLRGGQESEVWSHAAPRIKSPLVSCEIT